MVEMHVVRRDNSHLYAAELEQNWRGRYKACVLERGWKQLERPDGRDIDQFDTNDTIHLLAIESGQVIGGIRAVPSTGPTLLGDLFPYLSAAPLIASPDIYELTRILVAKEKRGKNFRPTVESCVTAASMECALALGMSKVRAMIEPWRIARNLNLGWTLRSLGPPHKIDGVDVIAVEKDISEKIWVSICMKTSIGGSILVWKGTARPSYRLPELLPAVA
jgi:acyl-homoserine lactone synthase